MVTMDDTLSSRPARSPMGDRLTNIETGSPFAAASDPERKAPPPEGFLCQSPFEYVHIQANGDVYPCCPSKFGRIIGNVNTASLREIWNSSAAREVQESILDGSYRFCNARACEYLRDAKARQQELSPPALVKWTQERAMLDPGPTPSVINMSFDRSCNLRCGYCRNELYMPGPAERQAVSHADANVFGSGLENTERIVLLGEGDPFASAFYREKLRHYDWSRHPKLRIKIQTNGLLLTPGMWESIAASHTAIDWISVSVDAADAPTYRLNRGGDFDTLLRNLDFIAILRALGRIEHFFAHFLVQANNYRQMPAFAKLGQNLGCDLIEFQRIENWGTYDDLAYRERAVHEPFHPQHQDFRRVLDHPDLQQEPVWLLKLGAQPLRTGSVGVMSCKGKQTRPAI